MLPVRNQVIDFLRRELVGPDPVPSSVQANGEEILTIDPPRLRYGAGVLFPQASAAEATADIEPAEEKRSDDTLIGDQIEVLGTGDEGTTTSAAGSVDNPDEASDETVSLANAFLPSAMGISFLVRSPHEGLDVAVAAASYRTQEIEYTNKEGDTRKRQQYLREPFSDIVRIPPEQFGGPIRRWQVAVKRKGGNVSGLSVHLLSRPYADGADLRLTTVTLVNTNTAQSGRARDEMCFFQVRFEVVGVGGAPCFLEYPEDAGIPLDAEEESQALLYRHCKTYAIGHGCAAEWVELPGVGATSVRTETLPTFETKPFAPTKFDDLRLSMYDFSDLGDEQAILPMLRRLCDKYTAWIETKRAQIDDVGFPNRYRDAAARHVTDCRSCHERMVDGVDLLEADPAAMCAFRLANRAMLLQQLHYGLALREWQGTTGNALRIDDVVWPDLKNPPAGKGSWYPFQIAFILLNVRSIIRPTDQVRGVVDLIWFPTGGGKSEAYLGLTAFTILHRRIVAPTNAGTTVLMRYTLRLLTAQQFDRAAALICALELIREESKNPNGSLILGDSPITIGLWVGNSVTPGSRGDAVTSLRRLADGNGTNQFALLRCPWCGAQMGPIKLGNSTRVIGYERQANPTTVIFSCKDPGCRYSGPRRLPLVVIDEEIYGNPPSLVIGTVDKFATMPWKPESRRLFGLHNDNTDPPELIIQDELHLISGPLGSMVGHYETAIQELCTRRIGQERVPPKIIASTATISRASEQCHSLYACGIENVCQFPPQCLQAGDSFFAYEDLDATGRTYVGVHASALPSHVTAQVRVMAALLQAPLSAEVPVEADRDPYWTLVAYFNSLRELGHAATLVRADIREYLNAMWLRKDIKKPDADESDRRRFTGSPLELTSRVSSDTIPESLQKLMRKYPADGDERPVDVCLATNMLSVGVDVPRLGLMTVVGQPKTTSEYIQATSRVGRSQNAPGLVVSVYNTAKPRDRSHFEHFRSYHASIYRHVEPTSVTPFAAPVRERALHALLVALVRFWSTANLERPQPFPPDSVLSRIRTMVEERVAVVDPDEQDGTVGLLRERLESWQGVLPSRYGDFGWITEDVPLMYPAGSEPSDYWEDKSWPTPTSMRDVDATCEAQVIGSYPRPEREAVE